MSVEQTKFCPKCGSPRVDEATLIGSSSKCRNCGWTGSAGELASYQFKTSLLDGVDVVTRFSSEVRDAVAKDFSLPIGKVLVKWGFLPPTNINAMVWGRYMNAIARAAVTAIVETRDAIEAEEEKKEQHAEVR